MNNINSEDGLIDSLSNIPEKSGEVRSRTLAIEEGLDSIEQVYDEVIARAEQGIPEDYEWRHSPESKRITDTEIEVSNDLDKIETEELAPAESATIHVEGGTVSEYIDRLVSRKEEKRELRSEFQGRIDSVKELSEESLNEFLESTAHLDSYENPEQALEGTWGEKLEQRLSITDGKRETRRIIEDIVLRAEAEEEAIEQELVNTVNNYVDEAYRQAVETSQQLGGKGRPHARELDILAQVSESRASLLENALGEEEYSHSNAEVAGQSGVLSKGKKAMEEEAYLIAQYASSLDQARDGIQTVIEKAEGNVDEEELEYARERLEAMEEGYQELGNAVADECYSTLADAVQEMMRHGMADHEDFSTEGNFSFQKLEYLGSESSQSIR
ncbi:hypothetical protein AQV86_01055 [Nanohaloarchaea archaeon SG9]|nr:hypothetical protein AQV86_01055 [Nanohaloarchaea archaeon SG9]